MAFPTGWSHKVALTISAADIDATLSDFPVAVYEGALPSDIFDADGSRPALNGGGDIRFSSDSAGSVQLPCEIVSFVTDNDPVNGSCEIYVKLTTISAITDTTFYLWWGATGETQPAVTDTYGRNAVWSAYRGVYHLENVPTTFEDSTGAYDMTGVNTEAGDSVADGIKGTGFAVDDDGTEYAENATIVPPNTNIATLSAWGRFSARDDRAALWTYGNTSGANTYILEACVTSDESIIFRHNTISIFNEGGNPARADNTWHQFVFIDNAGSQEYFVDAASIGTSSVSGSSSNADSPLRLLYNNRTGDSAIDMDVDEVRFSLDIKTDAWITAEYESISSNSTWLTAGTIEDVSSDVTVTPVAASAVVATISPSIELGGMSLAPAEVSAIASSIAPAVIQGNVSITPAIADVIASTISPSIEQGSLTLSPEPCNAIALITNPGVEQGSLILSPNSANAIASSIAPDIQLSTLSLTPSIVSVISATIAPSVILGDLSLAPNAAAVITQVVNPSIEGSDLTVNPTTANMIASSVAPTVVLSDLVITMSPAEALTLLIDPVVVLNSLSLTPGIAGSVAEVINPNVSVDALMVSSAAVEAIVDSQNPTVVLSNLDIAPNAISAIASVTDPTIVVAGSSVSVTPAVAEAIALAQMGQILTIGGLHFVFKQTLTDNALIADLLAGGIFDAEDFEREGLSMDDVPRITSGSPRVAPFAVIRWQQSSEHNPTVESESQTVEIYIYQNRGYDVIDRVLTRLKVDHNDTYLTTDDRSLAHLRHIYNSRQMTADELGHLPFQFSRFMVNQVRK